MTSAAVISEMGSPHAAADLFFLFDKYVLVSRPSIMNTDELVMNDHKNQAEIVTYHIGGPCLCVVCHTVQYIQQHMDIAPPAE